ncbi:MAG TPA: hypothetical protein VNX67_06045 [Solirubrobacteraceae bacterium]|jgi:hypothetical protein|nr:hypothetical protein [Solirubrobacteraceae bacterium]
MRRLCATALTVLASGAVPASASALSSSDAASTHTTLVAAYKALHSIVTTWPTVEASLNRLDRRFSTECPNVGAGSPQNESAHRLSYEVAGALWATGYHTDAKFANAFINAVSPLRWSNPAIVHRGLKFIVGLHEMIALHVPDLCGDVRLWAADGFKNAPADTQQFDQHVESIEVEIPSPRILAPYMRPSDRGLLARVEHLVRKFEELEFVTGQRSWNELLETLALNQ